MKASGAQVPLRAHDAEVLRVELAQRIEADDLDLPILPDVAAQVLSTCQDPDGDPQRLAELIQRDPALAANTLRIANSAAYAAAEPIVSLSQAIARLGQRTMGDIAIAAALNAKVFVVPGREAEMLDLRRHAAATGMWTRELARHRRRNVEAAFLSGLMHDVGRPILLQAVLELASGSTVDEATLHTWIDELHATVGARLLERWNLPPWVSAAVAGHHFPGLAGPHRELAATVLLGDLFARAVDDVSGDVERELRRHTILGELGIYPDDLEQLFARKSVIQSSAQSFA